MAKSNRSMWQKSSNPFYSSGWRVFEVVNPRCGEERRYPTVVVTAEESYSIKAEFTGQQSLCMAQ